MITFQFFQKQLNNYFFKQATKSIKITYNKFYKSKTPKKISKTNILTQTFELNKKILHTLLEKLDATKNQIVLVLKV